MKSEIQEQKEKYLILLKIDAKNLFDRITKRRDEYMDDFSLKRDRAIFREVFYSRYSLMTMSELSHLSIEIIELANSFYLNVDELLWYLSHTQDMPNTIEDEILRSCSLLHKVLSNLTLYIDAELSGSEKDKSSTAL